jgi:uncharacterized protein YgbK (DUF1537 family)
MVLLGGTWAKTARAGKAAPTCFFSSPHGRGSLTRGFRGPRAHGHRQGELNVRLGCIADDFTGATDLANNLVRSGLRTVQTVGVPGGPPPSDADAVVIALKSRTIPAREAVEQSLSAATWLRRHGAEQLYLKYCSTFDSTDEGNIGPVTEALMDLTGCDFTVAAPAFPDNRRTVYQGHLFVGDRLLHESGMRHHPLTPMTDSDLVRVLQAQCRRAVGLIGHDSVAAGPAAIRERIGRLRSEGVGLAVLDTVCNEDLVHAGAALRGLPLVTGGSGLGITLARNWGVEPDTAAARLPAPGGAAAVVAGSCSEATNRQVEHFTAAGLPALGLDPVEIAAGADVPGAALEWAERHLGEGPVLIYSTARPEAVREVRRRLPPTADAGGMIEDVLARIARGLVAHGVGRLVVAGGETSGACVRALGVSRLRTGAQIDPGVPWCHAVAEDAGGVPVHIALKSGNFGTDDFFTKAFDVLGR